MANVLVNSSSLSAIAEAIRSNNKTSTTYKPAEMAEAVKTSNQFGESAMQYAFYEATTSTSSSIVPPDSVTSLDDVIALAGVGALSTSGSGAAATCIPYLYLPQLWDKRVTLDDGTELRACISFPYVVSSSSYYREIDLGLGSATYSSFSTSRFIWLYMNSNGNIALKTTSVPTNQADSSTTFTDGYMMSKYGSVELVYAKEAG